MTKLKRVVENDDRSGRIVHFQSVGIQDAVTICYKTDWLDGSGGGDTTDAVTCADCIGMVRDIQAATKEKF